MTESISTDIVTLLEQAGLPSKPWEVEGRTFHFVCSEGGFTHHLCGTISGVVITPKPHIELQVSLTRGPGGWPVEYLDYHPPGKRDLHELYEGETTSPEEIIEEHIRTGGWMLRTKDDRGKKGGFYGRWRGSLYLH